MAAGGRFRERSTESMLAVARIGIPLKARAAKRLEGDIMSELPRDFAGAAHRRKLSWRLTLRCVSRYLVQFVITVFGVYLAFLFAGWGDQRALDRSSRQWLLLAVLESHYVREYAIHLIEAYGQDATLRLGVKQADAVAATTAFADSNVASLLPLHKVSLVRSYVDAVGTLNASLAVHLSTLEAGGYELTEAELKARDLVHRNAAAVVAMATVLQEELAEFVAEDLFDQQAANGLDLRIKELRDAALGGF